MGTVDDYLAGLDGPDRDVAQRVVRIALDVVPDAEQATSYGMPALKHRGRPYLAVVATRTHLSLFPFSPAAVDAVRDRVAGFSVSKGTLRFSVDRPLPDDVVRAVAQARRDEIDAAR